MAKHRGIAFSDADIVNPEDWISEGAYNPHRVRPFLFHDHGFVVCVVFASSLSEALDVAADHGRLDRYAVTNFDDYLPQEMKGKSAEVVGPEGLAYLGNGGAPYDIESLDFMDMPNVKFSFTNLWEKQHADEG